MSSAAIPMTRNIDMTYRDPKYETLAMPCTITAEKGKLRNMIDMPTKAKKLLFRWNQK